MDVSMGEALWPSAALRSYAYTSDPRCQDLYYICFM